MCRHHSHYSLHDNLVNWFATYAGAAVLNYISRQPQLIDDYTVTWVAGALWGLLLGWAIQIGHEWIKTWRAA